MRNVVKEPFYIGLEHLSVPLPVEFQDQAHGRMTVSQRSEAPEIDRERAVRKSLGEGDESPPGRRDPGPPVCLADAVHACLWGRRHVREGEAGTFQSLRFSLAPADFRQGLLQTC